MISLPPETVEFIDETIKKTNEIIIDERMTRSRFVELAIVALYDSMLERQKQENKAN